MSLWSPWDKARDLRVSDCLLHELLEWYRWGCNDDTNISETREACVRENLRQALAEAHRQPTHFLNNRRTQYVPIEHDLMYAREQTSSFQHTGSRNTCPHRPSSPCLEETVGPLSCASELATESCCVPATKHLSQRGRGRVRGCWRGCLWVARVKSTRKGYGNKSNIEETAAAVAPGRKSESLVGRNCKKKAKVVHSQGVMTYTIKKG